MDNDSGQKPPGQLPPDGAKPKRRVRYKGTHPRRFHEKYKELNPDKYTSDVEKIIASGKTPAGTHIPIAVPEILQVLNPRPGETALDATMGYGGHSREILQKISPAGTLVGLDQDPIERPKTEERLRRWLAEENLESHLIVGAINFVEAKGFLRQQSIVKVDMVLADLGLSSMQMDTPERGFSYKVDAPLDLRMNPHKGKPAAEWMKTLSAAEIAELLTVHADEPHARQFADQLQRDKPQTTLEVTRSAERVMAKWSAKMKEKEGNTPVRRIFQAFRILVNDELAVLKSFLEDLPDILKPGGRVAILSFHSGEDRLVKKSFQAFQREGIYADVASDIVRPSLQEQSANPRSKSAKLRWAVRA